MMDLMTELQEKIVFCEHAGEALVFELNQRK